jgi:hypothetical protein
VNQNEIQKAAPASVDDFVNEILDQDSAQIETDAKLTDSATVSDDDTEVPDPTEAEKPTGDGFQKRIDKITADKYAEKRRADELQLRIDGLEKAKASDALKKPKLDDPDIDYDEDAYEKANRDYEIKQGVQDTLAKQKTDAEAEQQKTQSDKVTSDFNERVKSLDKADFNTRADSIPNLPAGVADAIMQSEQGAMMVYHLGSPENAEQAALLASMSPAMAMMELGKLSVKLSAKPVVKPSAAPEPIETLSSGSALSSNIGDEMSTADWFSQFG